MLVVATSPSAETRANDKILFCWKMIGDSPVVNQQRASHRQSLDERLVEPRTWSYCFVRCYQDPLRLYTTDVPLTLLPVWVNL